MAFQQTPDVTVSADRVQRLREREQRGTIQEEPRKEASFLLYLPALAAALFKDMLDFAFIGSLPLVGSAITFSCFVLIFFLLLIPSLASRSSVRSVGTIRMIALGIGGAIEAFGFGLNFLPISVLTVLVIYIFDRPKMTSFDGKIKTANRLARKVITHV